MVSVKDVDHGYAQVRRELFRDDTSRLDVGVLGFEALDLYDNGVAVWQAALWNEFGVPRPDGTGWKIPPRKWLRGWIDDNADLVKFWLAGELQLVARAQQTKEQALANVGRRCVHAVKQRILASEITPANADSTVKKKGFNFPLFETGKLLRAIGFKVTSKTVPPE